MSDLIDRQAAIDAVESIKRTDNWQAAILMRLHDQPTINAVEVVRCRDCINFTQGKDEWGSCFENPMKMWRDTDFCSWAERRTDAAD